MDEYDLESIKLLVTWKLSLEATIPVSQEQIEAGVADYMNKLKKEQELKDKAFEIISSHREWASRAHLN